MYTDYLAGLKDRKFIKLILVGGGSCEAKKRRPCWKEQERVIRQEREEQWHRPVGGALGEAEGRICIRAVN